MVFKIIPLKRGVTSVYSHVLTINPDEDPQALEIKLVLDVAVFFCFHEELKKIITLTSYLRDT